MKRVTSIVALGLLSIRCGAIDPAEELSASPVAHATDEPVAPARSLRERPPSTEDEERMRVAPGLSTLRSVSRATGDDGATYVAGLFSGTIASGESVLTSRGADDVYLARIAPDGSVDWSRAIGSKRAESDPRVTFADGEVKLLAFTEGEVDCGGGPLGRTWSSPMFFFCVYGAGGEPLQGGTFPTGAP